MEVPCASPATVRRPCAPWKGPAAASRAGIAAALILAAGAASGQTGTLLQQAFDRFEDRCVQALTDPAGYLDALHAMPQPDRVAANTPDGQVLMVSDATLPIMEVAQVAVSGRVQNRYCLVALLDESAQQDPTPQVAAFRTLIDARPDLSVVGGRVMASDAELAPHRGTDNDLSVIAPIHVFYIDGAVPDPQAVVTVTIQLGSFEIEGFHIVTGGG